MKQSRAIWMAIAVSLGLWPLGCGDTAPSDTCADVADSCEQEGATMCREDGTAVLACQKDDKGCLVWAVGELCGGHTECLEAGDGAACTCAGGCDTEGETRCRATVLESCQADEGGCLDWERVADCAESSRICGEADGVAQCLRACSNTCSAEGLTRCHQGAVEVCAVGDLGCRQWEVQQQCGDSGQVCAVQGGTASCADKCRSDCDQEGATRCDGSAVETCTRNGDCLNWVETDACLGEDHRYCYDETGEATCSCEAGYAGADCTGCAAGYQDNDQDGTCLPDCASSGLDCGAHGHCVDGAGKATCVCDHECDAGTAECRGDVPWNCVTDEMGCRFMASGSACDWSQICSVDDGRASCQAIACDEVSHDGHLYLFCSTRLTWDAARAYCRGKGYHLVSITDDSQNSFLWDTGAERGWTGFDGAWIGLTDAAQEGTWVWTDGSPTDYLNWNAGEPNDAGGEDCGVMWTNEKWNDLACSRAQPFICEKEPDCTTVYQGGDTYLLCDGDFTWSEAEASCAGRGFELASVTSQTENDLLRGEMQSLGWNGGVTWIGYSDAAEEGRWTWSDGTGAGYENWASGYPAAQSDEDDCAAFQSDGTWVDRNCALGGRFVCKRGPHCAQVQYQNHVYLFCDSAVPWDHARSYCESQDYDMVSINSDDENTWLYSKALDYGWDLRGGAWTGFNDLASEGNWEWTSGEPVTYTNWEPATHEPNGGTRENCGVIWGGATWNDSICSLPKPYICERGCDPPVTSPDNGHIYWWCGFSARWADAQSQCEALGGNLASIDSLAENTFVGNLAQAHAWLGGTDAAHEGTWQWQDGSSWSFEAWRAGEPNDAGSGEDCLEIYNDSAPEASWNDAACSAKKPFVCEASKLCDKPVYNPDNGHLYQLCHMELSWADARAVCMSGFGGDLASIGSDAENLFVSALLYRTSNLYVFLGGTDSAQEGQWTWSDGTSWNYANWQGTEPNNYGTGQDCLAMSKAYQPWGWVPAKWADTYCSQKLPFVCEKPFEPWITQRAIFLGHGIGADKYSWNAFADYAEAHGFQVYRISLSADPNGPDGADDMDGIPDDNRCGSLPDRATEVAQYISRIPVPPHKLKAVGHSMGGLDLRYIVAKGHEGNELYRHAARKFSRVYTLATPHNGNFAASLDQMTSSLDYPELYACRHKPCMAYLQDSWLQTFNANYPWATTFISDDVVVPFLAYTFECPWCGGWNDCVVATSAQQWYGAPVFADTIHGAKHSADVFAGVPPCRVEQDILDEVAWRIMDDFYAFPVEPRPYLRTYLFNLHTGKCAEGDHQYWCHQPLNHNHRRLMQSYVMVPAGNGYYEFHPLYNKDLCLGVEGGSDQPWARVQNQTCTGASWQRWKPLYVEPGNYMLQAGNSNLCLLPWNNDTAPDNHLNMGGCDRNMNPSAQWRLIEPQDKWLLIRSRLSGKVIEAPFVDNGGIIQQFGYAGVEWQVYFVTYEGDGKFALRNMYTDRCMVMPAGWGDQIVTWDCVKNKPDQLFYIERNSDGYYRIRGVQENKCVAATGTNDGDDLAAQTCSGAVAQQWSIERL